MWTCYHGVQWGTWYTWDKPRSNNKSIESESLLNLTIYPPDNTNRKRNPIEITLRRPFKNNIISDNTLHAVKTELCAINSKIGYAYLLEDKNSTHVELPLGLKAQENSILQCHMTLYKSNDLSNLSTEAKLDHLYLKFPITDMNLNMKTINNFALLDKEKEVSCLPRQILVKYLKDKNDQVTILSKEFLDIGI